MDTISPEFIERYQLLLEKEPKSKVFAPLAEAYRKIGLAHKAYSICKTGLNYHPNFAGGHIAMARTLMDLEEVQKAQEHLEKATELAPENILAYQVLAELKLRSKQPKEALKAFKMVLFLSPDNFKAQNAVKKLESLTADEFPESLFDDLQVKPFTQNSNQDAPVSQSLDPKPAFIRPNNFSNDAKQNRLERYLSLMDAYIVRNDNDKAMAIFTEARMEFANHTELLKRLHIINPQTISQQIKTDSARGGPPLRQQESSDARVQILRKMLFNINKRRKAKIQD